MSPRKAAPDASRIVVRIEEPKWRRADVPTIRRAARLALSRAKQAGELTILLSGDAGLERLNTIYRKIARPTNVLAFPAQGDGYLGDVAIAFETTLKEARAQKKDLTAHASHLAVHGVLHLLGYDHERVRDARKMEALEVAVLKDMQIGNPYD